MLSILIISFKPIYFHPVYYVVFMSIYIALRRIYESNLLSRRFLGRFILQSSGHCMVLQFQTICLFSRLLYIIHIICILTLLFVCRAEGVLLDCWFEPTCTEWINVQLCSEAVLSHGNVTNVHKREGLIRVSATKGTTRKCSRKCINYGQSISSD